MKFFNTAGPNKPELNYTIPPLERLNLPEVLEMIDAQRYFVMHAPRQTGKTSCLLALQAELNQSRKYACVYCNIEAAQAARENVNAAMSAIVGQIALRAEIALGDRTAEELRLALLQETTDRYDLLNRLLARWAQRSPKPLVLFIDEVDALIGDTLIAVLRQLRMGYDQRPAGFPHSIILCGVRDVRDYRIHSAHTQEVVTGGSAFNIKTESLRLGNFSPEEIRRLYEQHTAETGQLIAEDVYPLVWDLTGGQPWLVNALAEQACFRMKENRDRTRMITTETFLQAKEQLILRRDTHLDQLTDKLREPRVRRVIEPLLANREDLENVLPEDLQYVRDLGLISLTKPVVIANAIYREIIPRELTWVLQEGMSQQTQWYVASDGRLDFAKLLTAFQQFFREHSEHWVERFDYKEAGPQLLLQAFLQRIVNGGGRIEREYGLGRKRTDLLVIWPAGQATQRVVLELKLQRGTVEKVLEEGLAQTGEYLDRCGAQEGHLVIFDRRANRAWEEKIYHRTMTHGAHTIQVWGL
jgi:hypothetical protein